MQRQEAQDSKAFRKKVKASYEKSYVFPDGTQVFWSATVERVIVKPKKGCGVQISASSFGGVVFAHSIDKDLLGNPVVRTVNP